jgi:hypothetical protein
MEVVGYYVDRDGDKTKATDVFVLIEFSANGKFEYYCPVGQHGEGYSSYIAECNHITKEEYLEASEGLYTPSDYL